MSFALAEDDWFERDRRRDRACVASLMRSREYRRPLDETGMEWLRVRFMTEGGQVTAFTAQYETMLNNQPAPVVRFDTAHGFPHLDVLNRRGTVIDKVPLLNQPTLGMALTYALKELEKTWPSYREAFLKDEP